LTQLRAARGPGPEGRALEKSTEPPAKMHRHMGGGPWLLRPCRVPSRNPCEARPHCSAAGQHDQRAADNDC
jgi:hypothetical protein